MPMLGRIERYTEEKLTRRVVDELRPKHKVAKVSGKKKSERTPVKSESGEPKLKQRLRDRKQKGKPDWAKKKAAKAARQAAKGEPAPEQTDVITSYSIHYTKLYDDAIVLSDFIAQRLPPSLVERANELKARGNRFNAVGFSRHGKPGLMQIFDDVWRFDTSLSGRLLRKVS